MREQDWLAGYWLKEGIFAKVLRDWAHRAAYICLGPE